LKVAGDNGIIPVMTDYLEVHDEIILKPWQCTAFDCRDPELVAVFNQLQDLREAIGNAGGNVFGWLRLPFMNLQRQKLEKKQLDLELRDYMRIKYSSGAHG